MRARGVSQLKISIELAVALSTIGTWLKPTSSEAADRRTRRNALRRQALALRAEGYTYQAVGLALGIKESYAGELCRFRRRRSLDLRPCGVRAETPPRDPADLVEIPDLAARAEAVKTAAIEACQPRRPRYTGDGSSPAPPLWKELSDSEAARLIARFFHAGRSAPLFADAPGRMR